MKRVKGVPEICKIIAWWRTSHVGDVPLPLTCSEAPERRRCCGSGKRGLRESTETVIAAEVELELLLQERVEVGLLLLLLRCRVTDPPRRRALVEVSVGKHFFHVIGCWGDDGRYVAGTVFWHHWYQYVVVVKVIWRWWSFHGNRRRRGLVGYRGVSTVSMTTGRVQGREAVVRSLLAVSRWNFGRICSSVILVGCLVGKPERIRRSDVFPTFLVVLLNKQKV